MTLIPHTVKMLGHRRELLICALLIVIVAGVYWQSFGFDFVNYDDTWYVTRNSHVKEGLTVRSVAWAFSTGRVCNWHPVTWLSHILDYSVYGMNAGGHHSTNLLLHALNALLLFLLLSRMTGRAWRSAFVAALFAAHPLHVESVVWIAERKDVLSGFFWIATMLAYVWYTKQPSVRRYIPVALLFAVGLMSKPMLVTLPFVLLLMDYWPLGRFNTDGGELWRSGRALVREKIPLFVMAAASSIITLIVQAQGGAVSSIERLSIGVRTANAFYAYIKYIVQMFWPTRLAVIYPHPENHLPTWEVWASGVALALVSALAVYAWRRLPYLAVGWIWFVVTLIPVIGLVQVGMQAMADRYTYLPYIGLFIVFAWGVPDALRLIVRRPPRALLPVGAGAIVAALAVAAWFQVGHWRSSTALFEHALACTSGNFIAHMNMAAALEAKGDVEEALDHYRTSVHICPALVPAQKRLGELLMSQGMFEEAITPYAAIARLEPDDASAHYNLGLALQKLGRLEDAAREYREAIRLKPRYAKAHGSLGNVLFTQGKVEEAVEKYREVLRINPHDKIAQKNLAAVLGRKGKPPGENTAIPRDQEETAAGVELAQQGRVDEAMAHYTEALRINPRNPDAHCNLGVALASQGNLDDAIAHYMKALKADPKHVNSHINLGAVLGMQGKLDEAIWRFSQAARLAPSNPSAHSNLAIALFQKASYAEAWREVHLCEKYGGAPNPAFIQDLSSKMPDPGQ